MRATSKVALVLVSVAVLLSGGAAATVRAQSALDGFDPNANGTIRAVVVQPDGKILIGGDFTTVTPNGGAAVNRSRIARLNPDGTVDLTFSSNANANGPVNAIAVQADGKILVGGAFTMIGGAARNNIARVTASGAIDSFDPNANNDVHAIAVQADGKILVGGDFLSISGGNSIGGAPRNSIARLDPTTGAADSFNPNANSRVSCIVVQADGKILAGGQFSAQFGTPTIGGATRNRIVRLDPVTGLADSFDPNANSDVRAVAVQADGKILAGGIFTGIGGAGRNRIARLDPTSGAADSFNPNANNIVNTIAVQADGKILIGGTFFGPTSINGTTMRNRIARLDPTTGTPDTFDPNANSDVNAIAVQADGKVLAGGLFNTLTPNSGTAVTRNRIARLEIDGRLDQTLNLSTVGGFVLAPAEQPDGKILIGGLFSSVLGVPRSNIARLNTDGTLDAVFDPKANNSVSCIVVQADGKILVGGAFISIANQPRNNIARLKPDGTIDDTPFNPNANSDVRAIAVQVDGKILVGGFFTSIGGQPRNHIARLNQDGTLDMNFDPNANGTVFSVAVQADGKILAGGDFNGTNSIGGQTRNYMARLNPVTGAADSFNPNANALVAAIALQADGKILAGGDFTSIGAAARNGIARLDPTTTGFADSFNPNANSTVYSIAVQADGRVLAGGNFSFIGGASSNYLARLKLDGTLDTVFNPNANHQVLSIAMQADGKVLAGGDFTNIGGQPRSLFARLTNDTAALQGLAVTQSAITWTRGGASPQVTRVTFESSTDSVNYIFLGNGTATGSNWALTGLNLQTGQNIYIRARGYYPSGQFSGSGSITESVRYVFIVPPPPGPTILANISTRLPVETGDNVLIGGFIVTGTQPKKVIVRAIGPSLPVTGALADPILELHGPDTFTTIINDNWRSDQQAEIIATGVPPNNDLESAIVATLPANNSGYTAIVRGANNGTGIGLVEAYDLDRTVDSKLANISTRGLVQTGDNVLIAGTIVLGATAQRVIIRAIGPSLTVPGKLQDPTLELRDGNGALIQSNDNWRSDQQAEIIATGIPPGNDLESAIVATLPAGGAASTAIVRGVNGTTGVAVVEVYALN